MDQYEQWLAQMPREGVRQRIAQLERELEILRQLERLPIPSSGGTAPSRPTSLSPSRPVTASTPTASGTGRRKLSPERQAILDAVRERPEGMAPVEVARHLGRDNPNPIQTNMSRMVNAGLLVRVAQGRYQLADQPAPASLLNGATPEGVGHS
jgi:hypothetical protein